MTDKAAYRRLASGGKMDGSLLRGTAERLLNWGPAVVALKLGDQGVYLRTAKNDSRFRAMGRCAPSEIDAWKNRELLAPCFKVNVAGTTGSGDCTIAGFLAGLLNGLPPEGAMNGAAAVGACNVEMTDASSGIPSWEQVWERVRSGWKRLPVKIPLPGFKRDGRTGLYYGPAESK
jgi:sugar/nucleoside kinase (ribokinase family)